MHPRHRFLSDYQIDYGYSEWRPRRQFNRGAGLMIAAALTAMNNMGKDKQEQRKPRSKRQIRRNRHNK